MGIGSYASPGWLVSGRARMREKEFGPADVDEMFEDATRIAIADQIEAGLDVITDGELSRSRFVFEMFGLLDGLERVAPVRKLGVPGYDMAPHFTAGGSVSAPRGLGVVKEFETLRRLAPGRALKVAIPGPLTFATYIAPGAQGLDALLDDLGVFVRAELDALVAAGADYIQLDEPGLSERPGGMSFADGVAVINSTLVGLDARTSVHVCFGNNAGRPLSDRNLPPLVPALRQLEADEVSIEMANREMAQADVLGELAAELDVAVGVVDVKSFHVETAEQVCERVMLCARHAPARRLRLTGDCGFSALPRSYARRKLHALVAGAQRARERLGLV
jgi:5-methyltetrahydropteroyltriglutamate--homocysteine methyltransferase